ncbi:MAG: glycosyltransferase [Chloroflexota bacterium]
MAERRKVIQVLHHSLSKFRIGSPDYVREEGWHIRLAREIRKRSGEYDLECWRPEVTVREVQDYRVDDIPCRLFPSFVLPAQPGREWSGSLLRAVKAERAHGPLLVHLHGIFNPITYAVAFSLPRTPKLAQDHGALSVTQGLTEGLRRWDLRSAAGYAALTLLEAIPERRALRRIDQFFALNRVSRAYLAHIVGEDRVKIQTMGLDLDRFRPGDKKEARRQLDLDLGRRYVLFVGNLVRKKGVDYLLRAFLSVLQAFPDSTLLLVGDGKERRKLEALSQQLGIARNVKFIGWVDHGSPRFPLFYHAADVLVVSSWQEGFGLTAAEGLASGVPFVGTEVPATPDIVDAFGAGWVVPCHNSEAMGGAIVEALRSGASATIKRETGERRYSWDSIVGNTLKVYDSLFQKYYNTWQSRFLVSRVNRH